MQHRNAIQPGSKIKDYVVETVLGQGGFGITYLAHDEKLDRRLAIKEYFPSEFVTRENGNSVYPQSESEEEVYQWGLERFLNEGRTLAKFKHPNIVRVVDYLEENNTAYIVMEYEYGRDLQSMLKGKKTLNPDELLKIFLPLLDGLNIIHEAGFIHRDIKPANIFIRDDGSPVLIDFGSARQGIATKTKTLTTLISPGYAPFEQYGQNESGKQGPWTDIYALGASMYRALFGRSPLDAVARAEDRVSGHGDSMMKASALGEDQYPKQLLQAIDFALEFLPKDRPQNITEWEKSLLSGIGSSAAKTDEAETIKINTSSEVETLKLTGNQVAPVSDDGTGKNAAGIIQERIAITNYLVLGLLTLWSYTAYMLSIRLLGYMENMEGTVRQKNINYVFSGVYAVLGLFILSWILPNVFFGYQYGENYILKAVFVSSLLFYVNTIAFILWFTKNIKSCEKTVLSAVKKQGNRGEKTNSSEFILKWEKIDNNVMLFLIIALPIIYSPFICARVFYSGASGMVLLALPLLVLFLGGIFHIWGTRLLVNIYNQFLELQFADKSAK